MKGLYIGLSQESKKDNFLIAQGFPFHAIKLSLNVGKIGKLNKREIIILNRDIEGQMIYCFIGFC